jgi:hypothetical protein
MARAYGSSAHLLMKRETTYGQAATGVPPPGRLTCATFLPTFARREARLEGDRRLPAERLFPDRLA